MSDLARLKEPGARVTAGIAFIVAVLFVFCTATFPDEVTILSHSLRLLDGQVMYRDFFEFLGPLSSWLPALLFLAVAPSLQAARWLSAGAVAVTAWQLYHLGRHLALPGWVAALPGVMVAVGLYASLPGYSHHWIIQPLIWGAVLAASTGLANPASSGLAEPVSSGLAEPVSNGLSPPATPAPRALASLATAPRAWATAGLATGLACLTVQTDGLALAAALTLSVLLDGWLGGTGIAGAARRLAALFAGFCLPVAVAVGILASQHALGAALHDIWFWPLQHYKTAGGINDVKYLTDLGALLSTTIPDFKLWRWYVNAFFWVYALLLPPGVAVLVLARAGGVALARARGGAPWPLETARLALVAIVMLGLLMALVRGRADSLHAIYYLPASILLTTVFVWRWQALLHGRGMQLVRWLPFASLLAFGVASTVLWGNRLATDAGFRLRPDGPDGRLRREAVVVYLRTHAQPGDRLVVYPLGGLYYFYGLPPATRYTHMLDPKEGYYDAADQADFWQEAKASKARFVVFAPVPADGPAPVMPFTGYGLVQIIHSRYLGKPSRAFIYEREAPAKQP